MESAPYFLVCVDRDGTITKDENFYLGKDAEWKSQVELLPGVVEGIRLLRGLQDTSVFVTTRQSGVAIRNFELLTERRVQEVNEYIATLLAREGVRVDGWCVCPFVDRKYVDQRPQYAFDPRYVRDGHPDIKPGVGLIHRALEQLALSSDRVRTVYAIGDRLTDVLMGLNWQGKGVLVPGPKTQELGDLGRFDELRRRFQHRVHLAETFLDAALWICADVNLQKGIEQSEGRFFLL